MAAPSPQQLDCPLSDEGLRLLQSAFSDSEFYPQIVEHVLFQMHRRYWWAASGRNLPGGESADDIAQQAVNDLLEGRRKWDLAKQPDLFRHLCDIADSLLNGCVESWQNRMIQAVSPMPTEDEDGEERPSPVDGVDPKATSAAAQLQLKEFLAVSTQQVRDFLATLGDDVSCLEVARTLAFEADDPNRRTAVKKLNLSEKDYDNVKKRLARRWTKFMSARPARSP
jgi:hypothetical protein